MPRKPALTSVRNEFKDALDGAANLYTAVRQYCDRNYESLSEAPLHFRQARRVVALAFLWTVASWEEFVDGSFIRYIAGAHSPSGWAPGLSVGPAKSLQHACELITGRPGFDHSTKFLNWTCDDIVKRSCLFLEDGNRFTTIVSDHRRMLDDAFLIRNRVAHASHASREKFKEVAQRLRGSRLHQSYSVGDLLLEAKPRSFPATADGDTIFTAYISFFSHLCDQIVP